MILTHDYFVDDKSRGVAPTTFYTNGAGAMSFKVQYYFLCNFLNLSSTGKVLDKSYSFVLDLAKKLSDA
jgi:hypothetical protein